MGTIPHLHLAGRARPSKVETSTARKGAPLRQMQGTATNFDISASTAPPRRIAGKGPPRGPRFPLRPAQRDDFLAGQVYASLVEAGGGEAAFALIWSCRIGD